jgi:hypothetical protein
VGVVPPVIPVDAPVVSVGGVVVVRSPVVVVVPVGRDEVVRVGVVGAVVVRGGVGVVVRVGVGRSVCCCVPGVELLPVVLVAGAGGRTNR